MSIFYQIAEAQIIQLPNNFTTQIGSTTTDLLSTFSPYIILLIGILIAGIILEVVISAIRHK